MLVKRKHSFYNLISKKTYTVNNNIPALAEGELFIGIQRVLNSHFQGQIGLAIAASSNANLSGTIWDDANPNLKNNFYTYSIQHNHLALKGKLIMITGHTLAPYVSAGAGAGYNQARSFTITPSNAESVADPEFLSHTQTSFTYTLGAGMQKAITDHWQAGFGYEFANWGKNNLAAAPGQTVGQGPDIKSSVHPANAILIKLYDLRNASMNTIKSTFYSGGAGAIMLVTATLLHSTTVPAFGITPISPTAMLLPANSSSIVQYQVINQTQNTRTLTIQAITGISQITNGTGYCPSPFTLPPQASCLLTLQVNGNQIPSRITGGPVVCKTQGPGNNNPDPFLCSKPDTIDQLAITLIGAIPDQQAYITNWTGNSISLCDVSTFDGSLNNCTITASGTNFGNPEAVALNPGNTFLYVANIGNSNVLSCPIDSTTGALNNGCFITGSGFNGADGIAINPAGTLAYVSNAGNNNSVTFCQVDSTSGALGNCNPTGSGFKTQSDLTINAAGTVVYVSDLLNFVSVCQIDNTTGELSCSNIPGGFAAPEGIKVHPNGQYAYISNNGNNSISVCKISYITGGLYSCTTTQGNFNGFGNIAFNNLGTRAYIPQMGSSRVLVCLVNQNNGALSLCTDSKGSGFSGPSGIILK